MKKDIWIVCVEKPNMFSTHSLQMIHKASQLESKEEIHVVAICFGEYAEKNIELLYRYGANDVLCISEYTENYIHAARILEELYTTKGMNVPLMLFPATDYGKYVSAELATRLGAALTADCVDIVIERGKEEEQFVFVRAAMNSTILASIKCINTKLGIGTFKKDAFELGELNTDDAKIAPLVYKSRINHSIINKLNVISSVPFGDNLYDTSLDSARIVIGIGRGIRNTQDLELIQRVANKRRIPVVGTRAVVENGLLEKEYQVGQSGINIAPEIYIAVGISGASQHIVGISNAKTIIAVNTDADAPIFTFADYCIREDYRKLFSILDVKGDNNETD